MKYVVQLSYTNPAHEHVSLRRRVDTVNRIVEAANENQAILRASQQQRALGFMIKEAKIVKEKEKMKKKEVVVDGNEKTEVAASGGMKEEAEQVDEGSKRMSAAVKLQRAFEREKTTSDASRKRGEEMLAQARAEYAKKQAAKTNENVEQVDEANMRFDPEAAARPKSSDVKNFLNRDKNARAGAASKKYIRRMTKLGGLGPNQTKKDTEKHMKDYFEEVVSEESASLAKLAADHWKNHSAATYGGNEGYSEKQLNRYKERADKILSHISKTHGADVAKAVQTHSSDAAEMENASAGNVDKNFHKKFADTVLDGVGSKEHEKYKSHVSKEGAYHHLDEEVEQVDEASKEGKSVMYGMRASMKAMDLRHGIDSDKREAGYKMSPAVRAAQAKSDALSKVEKPVQAGTLAALKRREMRKEEVEYIEEKLSAGDPASKWISDFVASDNPKFAGKTKKERINMALGAYYAAKKGTNEEVEHVEEAADPGKLRVVNKKVEAQASKDTKTSEKKSKATEKAIDAAKSKKNPVNLKPVLAGDKVNNA